MPNLPYTVIDADGHVHERDDQCASSDYPHERSYADYLHDIPEFLERPDLSDAAKRKVLRDNAQQFYSLASVTA
jgi:hypothetical protein